MPNGHGGYPFMGSPVLIGLMLGVALAYRVDPGSRYHSFRIATCLVLAAALGWRLAYHLHMRAADEYGGAYVDATERAVLVRRYRIFTAVYILAALGVVVLWMFSL